MEMIKWIKAFFDNQYEIMVWDSVDVKTFYLKKINKITHTQIKGIDVENKYFEYNTVEPFNYKIRKIH